eukprot:TRINITY_DN37422_c0_g1_i1.p1 TRINITY_DN37422_c0_g1~~TRINITY_DN37422_c0_g1_i1.p1  ORF type:complete len:372 (+),score=83.16 TRINITY_DN37422_c0_g1_i1:947-2062(+)
MHPHCLLCPLATRRLQLCWWESWLQSQLALLQKGLCQTEQPGAAWPLLGSLAPSEQVMSQVPTVPVRGLENKESVAMPVVALGTGTMAKQKVASSVAAFLSLGGRHLDTAAMYENYVQVREGIESSGLRDLSDLVITGKVMPLGREHVLAGIQEALAGLNVRSIDIMLLQWPGDNPAGKLLRGAPLPSCADRFERAGVVSVSWRRCRVESYKALVEEQAAGRVRAIGVSNFARRHLIDLDQEGLTKPAVHQLEFHPIWHEDTLLDISRAHGTEVQAYGCLGGAHTGAMLLRTEPILKTAARLNVTPAQVLLRWGLQRGLTLITGGSSEEHIRSNLDIFGFSLEPEDMEWLNEWIPSGSMQKSYGPISEEIL